MFNILKVNFLISDRTNLILRSEYLLLKNLREGCDASSMGIVCSDILF